MFISSASSYSYDLNSFVYDSYESPIAWLADESLQQYLIDNKSNNKYSSSASAPASPEIPNRIIGGINVKQGEFPFLVQLFRKFLFNNQFMCGGSLITSRTVLTAAHCVNFFNNYRIRYGSNSLLWSPYPEAEVKLMKPHKKFDLSTVQNDIALFILKNPIKPGSNVQIIELADQATLPGTNVSLYGFGLTKGNGNEPATKMQKTTLVVLDEQKCAEHISKLNIEKSPGMFCASSPNRSACNGDSGGPLVDTNTKKQIGIVSFGTRYCPAGSVNVFTNISYYKKWIDENKVE
ncbi:Group 6 mite allergen-like protein (serine protease) [Euroglyphus maynei]|uniref:Group 6 mite allergen-like protein (Serine protease) n=1 Tax=Euroglyphus maynei TaxID=6958 RepID=A0A1Y3AVK0_EURMA|nr:Group 6 mite allergen-like protein (serine protease) [Euroglyphus maynei]